MQLIAALVDVAPFGMEGAGLEAELVEGLWNLLPQHRHRRLGNEGTYLLRNEENSFTHFLCYMVSRYMQS